MTAVGKRGGLLDQSLYPRLDGRVRQIDISRLHNRRYGVRAGDLAAFRVYLNQAIDIVLQLLYHGRTIERCPPARRLRAAGSEGR
jgi:hypothetical protein